MSESRDRRIPFNEFLRLSGGLVYLAMLKVSVSEATQRWGLEFERTLDDLDWHAAAAFRLADNTLYALTGRPAHPQEDQVSIEVSASVREPQALLGRILAALDLDRSEVEWENDQLRAKAWRLWRQDDNGNTFHVQRYASASEAKNAMRLFEERGHKQSYWIEEDPEAGGGELA